jgi:hypothetical protein
LQPIKVHCALINAPHNFIVLLCLMPDDLRNVGGRTMVLNLLNANILTINNSLACALWAGMIFVF